MNRVRYVLCALLMLCAVAIAPVDAQADTYAPPRDCAATGNYSDPLPPPPSTPPPSTTNSPDSCWSYAAIPAGGNGSWTNGDTHGYISWQPASGSQSASLTAPVWSLNAADANCFYAGSAGCTASAALVGQMSLNMQNAAFGGFADPTSITTAGGWSSWDVAHNTYAGQFTAAGGAAFDVGGALTGFGDEFNANVVPVLTLIGLLVALFFVVRTFVRHGRVA